MVHQLKYHDVIYIYIVIREAKTRYPFLRGVTKEYYIFSTVQVYVEEDGIRLLKKHINPLWSNFDHK